MLAIERSTRIVCSLFIVFLVVTGCSEDKSSVTSSNPVLLTFDLLLGKWYWIRSEAPGGFTQTPDTKGYTKEYLFKGDGTFEYYKQKIVSGRGRFFITLEKTITGGDSSFVLHMLALDSNDTLYVRQEIHFVPYDTLLLKEKCVDCQKHYYIKTG